MSGPDLMVEPSDDRSGERDFEAELSLQKRAESMLMLRGAAILLVVSVLVAIRSILL